MEFIKWGCGMSNIKDFEKAIPARFNSNVTIILVYKEPGCCLSEDLGYGNSEISAFQDTLARYVAKYPAARGLAENKIEWLKQIEDGRCFFVQAPEKYGHAPLLAREEMMTRKTSYKLTSLAEEILQKIKPLQSSVSATEDGYRPESILNIANNVGIERLIEVHVRGRDCYGYDDMILGRGITFLDACEDALENFLHGRAFIEAWDNYSSEDALKRARETLIKNLKLNLFYFKKITVEGGAV